MSRLTNRDVMWGRRKNRSGGCSMGFLFVLGAIIFLIMEHPVVFWLVFVPLAISFVVYLLKFIKGGRSGLGHFATAMFILVVMVVVLMIVCIP